MTTPDAAAEHLRVIRQLMGRATIYRAISAPSAILGGLGAVAVSLWHHFHGLTGRQFLAVWLSLFLLLSLLNLGQLAADARRRGEPFLSSGMKLALKALSPPLLCGFVMGTVYVVVYNDPGQCAVLWCIFYGLALLATANFAPKSIRRLGAAMGLYGILAFVGNQFGADGFGTAAIMGTAFGLFHLIDGLFVILGHRRSAA